MRRFCLLLFLLLVSVLSLSAKEEGEIPPSPAALPGVAEVVPRLAELAESESAAVARVATLAERTPFDAQVRAAQERQGELDLRVAELGDPLGWSLDRLTEVRARLSEQSDSLRRLLEDLSRRLAELDAISQDWSARKEFWEQWEESLAASGLPFPRETITRARGIIAGVQKQVSAASAPLVELQQEVTALQEGNLELASQIDAALERLRRQTFQKTAPSFANPVYYRQFNAELWQKVKSGVAEVQRIDRRFLVSQGWLLIVQLLLAIALAWMIRRFGRRAEVSGEWLFIVHHPWATGIFVAVAGLSFFYTAPPAAWRLGLWVLAAFSAAVLISGLLRNPRKIFMVNLLAVLLVLSLTLKIFSFPLPLYRLYLAVLSLLGVPLLWLLASRNLAAREGRMDGFTLALRFGAAVLLAAFVAQAAGYATLASRLIESSVETVFLSLFAAMAIRLGRGGIDYLITGEFLAGHRFFQRFGGELAGRLKGFYRALVLAWVILYLLVVWGFYTTVGEAWNALTRLRFTWGQTELSVWVVLLAGLVLYATIVLSWMLRALLEAEVFPRKGLDRGVRDSIKKLLHYSLVLVGFLFAMSLAGLELKNFAVLAGAFGIGIGFGLQNLVNNFASGLILLFERPIKVGDTVVLDNEWGTVKKIGLRSTVVETLDQSEIIVPNSLLISEKVTNWTLSARSARVVVAVGVAYGSDVERVLRILQEAGDHLPEALPDPRPSPIFTGFGESSLDFELRVWIDDIRNRLQVKSALGQYIDRRFREEGVEIPFPQRDLHLRSVAPEVARKLASARESKGPAGEKPWAGDEKG